MPRIETLRLPGLRLRRWVAWHENDFGERFHVKLGFTESGARFSTINALEVAS